MRQIWNACCARQATLPRHPVRRLQLVLSNQYRGRYSWVWTYRLPFGIPSSHQLLLPPERFGNFTRAGPGFFLNMERRSANARGYNYRWQKYRAKYLKEHPLCVFCSRLGKVLGATVVDHIKPHRGDSKLFWDKKNHQALCKPCHDRIKQGIETGSKIQGCDIHGMPIDPRHYWNQDGYL